MTKLDGKTPDLAAENIEQLRQIFPDVFEEGKVDFDKLKQVLGEYVDDEKERYNFTWNGKGKALRLAQTPTTGTLRPCPEERESKNWNNTQNLYIEGDNLEVLKLLQKSYHGKIKMIYIDPPYNTGGDFVYQDDFSDSIENYKRITSQVDDEGKKLGTNTEANGRYHTDWLNMMYPRLRLARNLLKEDGVIIISIDDNEIQNLYHLCNEIFGEDNFVDNIIWKKRYGGGAKEKYLVSLHEYALMYCKNLAQLDELFVPLTTENKNRYYQKKDQNFAVRGGYRTHPLEATKSMDARENLVYPIPAPDGTMIMPQRQWLWSKDRAYAALEKGELEIYRGNDGSWQVATKQYLKDEDGVERGGKMFSIIENIYTQHGTNEMISILGNAKIFPFPKPSNFVSQLLQVGMHKNDIVLDFFSGSSTTAHAVMQLNAEDGGNRKFIMVQLPEPCAEGTEAAKAGYKNICEIGKERIRRAGEKIKAEIEEQNAQLKIGEEPKKVPDIGFKVFKLDSSNLKQWQPDYDDLETSLFDSISNYVEGRSELDVVYEIMLKMGMELTWPLETHTIGGNNVYEIGMGALMICLDDHITTEVAEGMAALYKELAPETWRVVFKDNGFADDSAKVNIKEILKTAGLEEDAFTTV